MFKLKFLQCFCYLQFVKATVTVKSVAALKFTTEEDDLVFARHQCLVANLSLKSCSLLSILKPGIFDMRIYIQFNSYNLFHIGMQVSVILDRGQPSQCHLLESSSYAYEHIYKEILSWRKKMKLSLAVIATIVSILSYFNS